MTLGLPVEFFIHEALAVAIYAALTAACARHWHEGTWAKVGAIAAALAVLMHGWSLSAWIARSNGHYFLQDQLGLAQNVFLWRWLDLVVLTGISAAILLGRRDANSTR
jgi:hypothetical protein